MQAAEPYLHCDDDAFFALVPDERDQYFVYGRGHVFELRQVHHELTTDEYRPTAFGYSPIGLVGLGPNGEIVAFIAEWARETAPMATAAAFLAASEHAKQRRGENASVNAWLDELFALPDNRN